MCLERKNEQGRLWEGRLSGTGGMRAKPMVTLIQHNVTLVIRMYRVRGTRWEGLPGLGNVLSSSPAPLPQYRHRQVDQRLHFAES